MNKFSFSKAPLIAFFLLTGSLSVADSKPELGPVNVRWLRILPVETANKRSIQFEVSTCLQSKTESFHNVDITREDAGNVRRFLTQTRGHCVYWQDMLTHNYYEPEKLFIYRYSIKNQRKDKSSGAYEVNVVLNPWTDRFDFAFDSRVLHEDSLERLTRIDGYRRRILTVTGMNFQSNLRGEAQMILKATSMEEGLGVDSREERGIRDGIYVLRYAIFTADGHVVQFVNGKRQLVEAKGSLIAVELPISNLTQLCENSKSPQFELVSFALIPYGSSSGPASLGTIPEDEARQRIEGSSLHQLCKRGPSRD